MTQPDADYGQDRLCMFHMTPSSALTAAATIAPASGIALVAGNTPISTITPPRTFQGATAGSLTLIFPNGGSLITGGNIATAQTAPVNGKLTLTYCNGTWY